MAGKTWLFFFLFALPFRQVVKTDKNRSKGSALVSSLPKLAQSTNSLEQNFVQAAVEPDGGNKKKQRINSNKSKTPAEADDK